MQVCSDSCKICVEIMCLYFQCRVGPTPLDVINVSVTVVFCFCFSVFRLLCPMFFPIISMHVKFIFEVIFLCNSDYVG